MVLTSVLFRPKSNMFKFACPFLSIEAFYYSLSANLF